MVMDWVFMEMYKIRALKEYKLSATTSKKGVSAKPMNARASVKNIMATIKGLRLSNLETSQPEIGNPIIELMGIANNTVPNCASLKLKKSLMVGIREAQVAKPKPDIKK